MFKKTILIVVLLSSLNLSCAEEKLTSPIILQANKGMICIVYNQITYHTNVKLWPGVVKTWEWKSTKTSYGTGLKKEDIDEFIDLVDIIIIGTGLKKNLSVGDDLKSYIEDEKGKELLIGFTQKVMPVYNNLVKEGKKVGGLFHGSMN